MIWLGSKYGYLTDWITQRWVQLTGRSIDLSSNSWLTGPIAPTTGIAPDYFTSFAERENLRLNQSASSAGIISDFALLGGGTFDFGKVQSSVQHFYERTAAFNLDAWAEWCGVFKPFGQLLAIIFSRRLQQLNVPLSNLDTSKGITNEVLEFVDPGSGVVRHTAWLRRLLGTGNILYAGFYSVCQLPGLAEPCVKVVFPLPNGNAIVIMRTECRADGSLMITSAGKGFGEPGFYFTVHGQNGVVWARYVRSLQETIHVYAAENGFVRADHVLKYFGMEFLRIHYRMTPRQVLGS